MKLKPVHFLIAGLGILFFVLNFRIYGDASLRFVYLSELYHFGTSEDPVKYSIIGPLFSFPLWFIVGRFDVQAISWWVARFNFILFLAALPILYRLLSQITKPKTTWTFLLILTFASMIPHHLGNYYPEIFTMLFAGIGLLAIAQKRNWGWIPLILGCLNTPASFLGLGFIIFYKVLQQKKLRYLGIIPLIVGLYLLETNIRLGANPFTTEFGYDVDWAYPTVMPFSDVLGFNYPFFFGLISILFSFGRGLVFYLPGLWLLSNLSNLKLKFEVKEVLKLWLLFSLGLVLIYSKWHDWHAGFFWGPRYFLFLSLPASLLLALHLKKFKHLSNSFKLITIFSLALSFWIGINGAVFPLADFCADLDQRHLCWYTPHFSELWSPFVNPATLHLHQIIYISFNLVVIWFLLEPIKKHLVKPLKKARKKISRQIFNLNTWSF